jgi:hypothetical protein
VTHARLHLLYRHGQGDDAVEPEAVAASRLPRPPVREIIASALRLSGLRYNFHALQGILKNASGALDEETGGELIC